jgi:hypothetical protein
MTPSYKVVECSVTPVISVIFWRPSCWGCSITGLSNSGQPGCPGAHHLVRGSPRDPRGTWDSIGRTLPTRCWVPQGSRRLLRPGARCWQLIGCRSSWSGLDRTFQRQSTGTSFASSRLPSRRRVSTWNSRPVVTLNRDHSSGSPIPSGGSPESPLLGVPETDLDKFVAPLHDRLANADHTECGDGSATFSESHRHAVAAFDSYARGRAHASGP